jgi:hypothetical protein
MSRAEMLVLKKIERAMFSGRVAAIMILAVFFQSTVKD